MSDPYHHIYDGHIFKHSECIWHENNLLDFFRSNLKSLGYSSISDSNKVWRRGNKTVVVCLVDDYTTCSERYDVTLPYIFDSNTVVITDTHVQVPTQYTVCKLPTSFFGIYAHQTDQVWNPSRRFTLGINRLDAKRLLLFLELQLRSVSHATETDHLNFNSWRWGGNNDTVSGLTDNLAAQYQELEPQFHAIYNDTFDSIKDQVPYRNHSLSQEAAHVSSWLNIVMETYSSDNTIALSEKIFRAICLPAPWMVYAGRNTVAYLHSLGFDTLQDVITHRYDNMIENRTAAYGDKMVDFLFEGTDNVAMLQSMSSTELQARCQSAAVTNQQRLADLRQQWPQDFATWWQQTVKKL